MSENVQPLPEVGQFLLPGGWACNQRQNVCMQFEVNISNVQRVADQLLALHRRQIAHGDLQPTHVRLTDDGKIVFLDCSNACTSQYASAELIFEEAAVKTPADDLEALLWMCWEALFPACSKQEAQVEDSKQERFVHRLQLMNEVLVGPNLALRSAFLHVWLLPRTLHLEDTDYQLPHSLSISDASQRAAKAVAAKMACLYSKKFPNSSLEKKNPKKSLQREWNSFLTHRLESNFDVHTNVTNQDLLLLFSKQFDRSGLQLNVQPVANIDGFASGGGRRVLLDNAPGDLVVLETSVRNKPLVDVLAHVRQLLPSPFRTLHVWFAFSSVVLVHKAPPPKQEQGTTATAAAIISTTGEMEDTLLPKCVAEGNFLGSVLAGSGRLGLFTQSADQQAAPPSPLLTVHAQQVDAERQTLKEVREIFEESSRQQETRHQQADRKSVV